MSCSPNIQHKIHWKYSVLPAHPDQLSECIRVGTVLSYQTQWHWLYRRHQLAALLLECVARCLQTFDRFLISDKHSQTLDHWILNIWCLFWEIPFGWKPAINQKFCFEINTTISSAQQPKFDKGKVSWNFSDGGIHKIVKKHKYFICFPFLFQKHDEK